jgi:hypothetical protein
MDPNPQQSDPQAQSPYEPDIARQSQFGMPSQADTPLQHPAGTSAQPGAQRSDQSVPSREIAPGAEVYGRDGKKVGTVQEVYQDSFLVQKGVFFLHDYYIPYGYVARATNDLVYLTLTSDETQHKDWNQRPSAGASRAQPKPPQERTPPYGNYGEAGISDTVQDATNRGAAGKQDTGISDRNDPARPWSRDEWDPKAANVGNP